MVVLRVVPATYRTIVGVAKTGAKSLNAWILDAIGNELNQD